MSHCTRFDFAYRDEVIAVKAFRRLGLRPETTAVSWHANEAMKKIAGILGVAGRHLTRAICAERPPYQYFLVRRGDFFELIVESQDTRALADTARVTRIEADFRLNYLRVVVEEELGRPLDDAGVPWRMEESADTLTVSFGADFRRHVTLRVIGGMIEEEVSGVVGAGCERLTALLENMLLAPTADLITEWKPAYHEIMEDEVVQVLRLGT